MEFLCLIAAVMLFFICKGFYDKKKAKERLIKRLSENWGKLPEEEYSEAKFRSLQYYYNHYYQNKSEVDFLLDSITWNDLNLNELFFMINNTGSAMGEEVLWALLHDLKCSENSLLYRNKLISFFENNEEARLKLQTGFALIGKNKKISVYEYMDRMEQVRIESNLRHFIGIGGIVLSVVLLCCSVDYAGLLLIGFILFNLITYYKRKGEIEVFYSVISYLISMLKYAEQISMESIPELEEILKSLKNNTAALKGFCKGAPAVTAQNATGDMMSFFLDYFRILFHSDLIRFNNMMKHYFDKKALIIEVFEAVGLLDAMCAVASFRTMLDTYCIPEFTVEKQFATEELIHPFLEKPIPASINTEKSVLITGSNASGKSTFIKSAAINAVLAQTIYTVCAKQYQSSFFKVYTSMALTDNLFGNESYYIVEIKSLKRIVDAAKGEIPVLCFVDEVLRGTNTVERIAASSRILHTIANSNALMFAATHDIELTYMLEHCFTNYHFEEQIFEDNITFDYQLKEGRATTQNAIALLGMLGYPEEIIEKAKQSAAYFIEKGEWQTVT
ncbi:MAG: hypothetical protein IJ353_05980 [Lachnospiraceae bacterium]|nr:hypothetical protein [Lachnospiraceae bacterium]